MQLIQKNNELSKSSLKTIAQNRFGQLVKAVVDINKKIMVIDADLHADQEKYLLEQGSQQPNLWGINLYPEINGPDWIEFDSMINLRPSQSNNSRTVENPKIQKQIIEIVNALITP